MKGSKRKSLYKQLDAAIDKGDFDLAAELKKQLDAQK